MTPHVLSFPQFHTRRGETDILKLDTRGSTRMAMHEITRRNFLASATLAITSSRASPLSDQTAEPPPPSLPDVVQVNSDFVVRGRRVHQAVLPEMIETALREVTGQSSSAEAWRSLLLADDVIGLKCNRSAAQALGTSDPFADAVIESLLSAGFDRQQIVPIEVSAEVYKKNGVMRPAWGWLSTPATFASGEDHLSAVLDQVTAIVNIPFLKTHNIAGMTCCLKNLSHGLIKHPARYHGSHCSPYIADIAALPQIRDKVRLNLVNGLRVVFAGGPEARDDFTWDAGILLASTDLLATDTVGLNIINLERKILGLGEVDSDEHRTIYLDAASERGLGKSDLHRIELRTRRI